MTNLTTEQIQSIESRVLELEEELSKERKRKLLWKRAAKGNRADMKYYSNLALRTTLLNRDGFTCEE